MDLDRIVLAHCLASNTSLSRCIAELKPEYFADESAQTIFKLIQDYYNKCKQQITCNVVEDMLDDLDIEEDVRESSLELFESLEDEKVDDRESEHYIEKLKRAYISRAWAEIEARFTEDAKHNYDLLKREAVPLFEQTEGEYIKRASIGQHSRELFDQYLDIEANPDKAYGVLTGFSVIDHETFGMHPGELWLVAGRPGAGKSIMLLNVAINAYRSGKNVMMFSLEMPYLQYLRRFHACYTGLKYLEIKGGKLTKEQKKAFKEAVEAVEQLLIDKNHDLQIIDVPRATALTIESEVRRALTNSAYRPDVIVVDYLGIMRSVKKGDADWQEQGYAAEELRKLARDFGIPVITAAQLTRDKKKTKGPERLARSDIIGATCDVYLQIEEKEEEEEEKMKLLDDTIGIYIGKCRDGRADQSFQLWKNFEKMQLKDKATFKTPQERVLEKMSEEVETDVEDQVQSAPDKIENLEAQQDGEFLDA